MMQVKCIIRCHGEKSISWRIAFFSFKIFGFVRIQHLRKYLAYPESTQQNEYIKSCYELEEGVLYIKKKKSGHLVVYSHLYNKCYMTTMIISFSYNICHIVVIYKYSMPHSVNCLNGFILIFCYIMMNMDTLKYMLHKKYR